MLRIGKEFVTDNCSPFNPPAARCHSGDTVEFETRDCYDDRLCGDGTVIDEATALENPATGPLYIEEAQPGDVLKVHIDRIAINPTGLMRCSVTGGAFCDLVEYRKVRQFDTSGEYIEFNDKLKLKIDTMIGVIGTAPEHDTVMTHTPGAHGGNMDCNKIVEGSTLYLPVNVPGALLSMGDLHALMGDGEVMICGLETGGVVTVTVEVIRDFPMPTPALSCRGRFYTIQSANTLDQASHIASRAMLKFLMRNTDMDVHDTAMLLSLVDDLSVCQIVDPQLTVRMGIDQSILDAYEVKLP
ncbi:MAG: acetamidase/formamidase family protein [Oscillospiraceae bacterium]|nr:acetamidase/formamidase family protein [Oscillospiraceae bacterium]